MFIDGLNISLGLVEQGLSKLHFTAEKTQYYQKMLAAETKAREQKIKVFGGGSLWVGECL